MTEQIYLGIDIGAESGRLMAGRWDGRRMVLEELHRFPNPVVAVAGTLRWDLLRLWNDIQHALGLAARRFGGSIVSIGIDTWALDFVLLSESDELLGLPYCYRDPRTIGMMDAAFTKVSRPEIFAETGLQFMEINTLYQLMALKRRSPELLKLAETFLMIPDWLNWCLTGEKAVEFTNATTTQFFNPIKRMWATDLLHRLGLPTHFLPRVIEPGTRLGVLTQSVRERTGLGPVPVVAPATHDTGSAVAGVPTELSGKPGWAYISSGTWSLMGIEAQQPALSPWAEVLNLTNEGGIEGTWRVLKNIMGLWLVQQCKRSFDAAGERFDYGQLTLLAGEVPALRSLIDPDDPRFLAPVDMTEAIRSFCREHGEPIPEAADQFVRCCLDSLALKYAHVLGLLEELSSGRINVIHIVGGGSKSALLNQLTANACDRTVVAGPTEATVLGNLLVQAKAAGELKSLAELRAAVRASSELQTFEPDPATRSVWTEARERFAKLLPAR